MYWYYLIYLRILYDVSGFIQDVRWWDAHPVYEFFFVKFVFQGLKWSSYLLHRKIIKDLKKKKNRDKSKSLFTKSVYNSILSAFIKHPDKETVRDIGYHENIHKTALLS